MTTPIAVAAAPATAPATTPTPANGADTSHGQPSSEPKPATAAPPKPPAPEQPWKAKRKLTIGGKEVEREYDDRRLQILEHQASKQAEYDAKIAEHTARMKRLEEDPDAFFQEAGIDVEAIIAARAERAEAAKAMSPEQRRIAELEGVLAKQQQAEQKRAQQEQVAAQQREHQERVQANVGRIGKAIELSGLPRSGELVRLYAEVQEMAAHAGEPEMSPEQVVSAGERLMAKRMATLLKAAGNEGWRARNADTLSQLAKAILPALEGDALLSWVGNENALRVVKALHAKTRTSPVPIVQETPREAPPPTQSATKPPAGWDEAMDRLGY